MAPTNKPLDTVRFGRVKATIWENQGENGAWHSVTLTRSYRDGEAFKDASNFSGSDLLVAAEALCEAYRRIERLKAEARASEPTE